jgi:3-deoxy-D-manno-octulosonic-acid transferase
MSAPALTAYSVATALLEPLAGPLLKARARRGKEDPERLGERLGYASAPRPAGKLVWLHGASVGEGLSLLPLIKALQGKANVLVTTGTVTSAMLLAERLPKGAIHQYAPVDAPAVAARFVGHWRPDLAVFAESELWPNLIAAAEGGGARLALISARLSKKSLDGWARVPRSARELLEAFDLVMAQDDETAKRLQALGARDDGRLNLKLAAEPLPVDAAALKAAKAAVGKTPVLLAASTHEGEEAQVLEAFAPLSAKARLVIAPRHPARGAEVAALALGQGFTTARQGAGDGFDGGAEVYVADALGELGLWFRLARAAFIGGSLVAWPGGHNPLEPALLRCPVIAGPHVDNWASIYAAMQNGLYRQVQDAGDLRAAFAEALAGNAADAESAERYALAAAGDPGALAKRLIRLI